MSCETPRCAACHLDRVFNRIAPMPNGASYGVEWRCPHCDDRALDLCPLGPVIPAATACLNCGATLADPGDFAACGNCGLTRLGARDIFGLDPRPADPMKDVESAFDAGLVRRGMAAVNQTLMDDPSNSHAWKIKYTFLIGLGYFAVALAVLDEAATHGAGVDAEREFARGVALAGVGRAREAGAVYRAYLETNPPGEHVGQAMCNLADLLKNQGAAAEAQSLYLAAIEKEPGQPTHYAAYVQFLLAAGRFDEAHPIIEKGWSLSADAKLVQRFLLDKAWALLEQNRGDEALMCLEAATNQGADGVRANYLRGRALALVGRLPEARAAINRVLEIEPNHPDAKQALRLLNEAQP